MTKFTFEKWSLILTSVFLWGSEIAEFSPLSFSACVFFTISTVIVVYLMEKEGKQFLISGELNYSPWLEYSWRVIVFWVIVGLEITALLSPQKKGIHQLTVATVCYLARAYFSACVPRPPCKGKVRQWYEKALKWFRDLREPAPVPEPG